MGKVSIELTISGEKKYIKVDLLGTRETLKKVKRGDILIIPNQEEWKSDEPFAILATKEIGNYQRIGLVQLCKSEIDKLQGTEKRVLTIGDNFSVKQSQQTAQTLQPTNFQNK